MRVLLIEDDTMIGESVMQALRMDHHAADWMQDGPSGLAAARLAVYDIVLLDLGLPICDGLTVLREMRSRSDATPVLILTARDQVAQRVAGLDAGADDYLLKPFDVDELAARMRALARRSAGRSAPVLEHLGLRLDAVQRQASLDGEPVALSAREWAILEALITRPGVVLSRPQLEEKLYGFGAEVASNTIEVHIHSLRKKLRPGLIVNIRGVGWRVPNGCSP